MQEKNDNKYTVLYKEPFSPPEIITVTYDELVRRLSADGGQIVVTSFAADVDIIHADNGTVNFVCGYDWIYGRAAFIGKIRRAFASLTQARINAIKYLFKWRAIDENENLHKQRNGTH